VYGSPTDYKSIDQGLLRVGDEGVTLLASEVEGSPIRFAIQIAPQLIFSLSLSLSLSISLSSCY
jgi:hypothetical protein